MSDFLLWYFITGAIFGRVMKITVKPEERDACGAFVVVSFWPLIVTDYFREKLK